MGKKFDYAAMKDEILRLYKKYGSIQAVRMRVGGCPAKLKETIGEENLKKYKKENVYNKMVWPNRREHYEEY